MRPLAGRGSDNRGNGRVLLLVHIGFHVGFLRVTASVVDEALPSAFEISAAARCPSVNDAQILGFGLQHSVRWASILRKLNFPSSKPLVAASWALCAPGRMSFCSASTSCRAAFQALMGCASSPPRRTSVAIEFVSRFICAAQRFQHFPGCDRTPELGSIARKSLDCALYSSSLRFVPRPERSHHGDATRAFRRQSLRR